MIRQGIRFYVTLAQAILVDASRDSLELTQCVWLVLVKVECITKLRIGSNLICLVIVS